MKTRLVMFLFLGLLMLFPSQSNAQTIDSTKQNDENVVIKLYNYYDHALKTIQLPALDKANKSSVKLNYTLNTEDLSPGVYLIETNYGNLQKSIKLIIQ